MSDADKTLKSLREAEIFDYSLNESDGTLKLLDFSLGESLEFKNKLRNLLVELKKEGVEYGEQTKRDIDSRYIDPGRRGEILEGLAGDAEFLRQGGGSLREVVEQSRQRHKEYTERVSDAKKTREEVEVQSQEEGIKREEGGQVRVRESAENRLETETGKIDEEKGQREGLQVRTWAYEIDDVAEMSIDIESMGREAAKEKVQEYKAKVDNVRKSMQDIITQNRSTLDKISPEYTKHLLRQVANAKPTNLKNTAQRIESIISNAQTQSKLGNIMKQEQRVVLLATNNGAVGREKNQQVDYSPQCHDNLLV